MGLVNMNCPGCGHPISLDESREFGFCNFCGTKVMVDKTIVEHKGSVKVDNSEFIQNSLANARRAKSKEDWEECEKYYNMVEQYQPDNIEAIFYSAYGKAKMSMVDADKFKREQKLNVLQKSISVIDDNYNTDPEMVEENTKMIQQINSDLHALVNGSFVYNTTKSQNGATTTDKDYTYNLFDHLVAGWNESLANILKKVPNQKDAVYVLDLIYDNLDSYLLKYNEYVKYKLWILDACFPIMGVIDKFIADFLKTNPNNDEQLNVWKITRKMYNSILDKMRCGLAFKKYEQEVKNYCDRINQIDQEIKKLDPAYVPEAVSTEKKGCYVATCVYGSYDCPQVWTLRRYRDNTLAKTARGRAFIRTYYAVSPTLVKWFGNTNWFKKMWQGKLDRMVKELNNKGVENTPYYDR